MKDGGTTVIIDNHPFEINSCGHLEIGGVDTIDLAKKYGTPLYVYDVDLIRGNCKSFVNTFKNLNTFNVNIICLIKG